MLRKSDELPARLLAYQTQYRALREHFLTLRQLFYQIACAWCQQHLGWKRKTAAVPGATSQSICLRCAADLGRKIALLTAALTPAAS